MELNKINNENNQMLTKRERKELHRQEKATEERIKQNSKMVKKWIKRIVALLLIAGSIVGIFWYGSNKPATPTNEILSVVSDDWVKGNKDAPITIVEYLYFECEACGAYYPVIKRLSEEYKDEVRFVVRYFPLPGHKNSMTSALAVETAGKQGKYWEMYDIVFQNQSDWGEKQTPDSKIFEDYAKQIGLDMNQYSKDIALKELKDRIERDSKTGQKLGIMGTPTFFINGEKIDNPQGYEDFKGLIQSTVSKENKTAL